MTGKTVKTVSPGSLSFANPAMPRREAKHGVTMLGDRITMLFRMDLDDNALRQADHALGLVVVPRSQWWQSKHHLI